MKRWILYRKSSGTIIRIIVSENHPDTSGDIAFLQVPDGIKFSVEEKIDSIKMRIAYEPIGENVQYIRSETIIWEKA
jgi:hypothetical protein